jgi:hypothetical protein
VRALKKKATARGKGEKKDLMLDVLAGSECSYDVHMCTLHSAHAHLMINLQLRFFINNNNTNNLNNLTINMQLRF